MNNQQSNTKDRTFQAPVPTALLLLLIGTFVAVHQFKAPPLMEAVAGSVGLSQSGAPWLMSVFTLVSLLFSIPAGTLLKRMPSKSALILSALLVVTGSMLGAVSNSAFLLLFSRCIEGFGFLLASIAIPFAAVTHADPAKIGLVMGICTVWISTGQILAFNTAPIFYGFIGWKGAWLVYGLFTLCALTVFHLRFRQRKDLETPPLDIKKDNRDLLTAMKNRNLIFPAIGFSTYNFCLMVMVTFFPGYAVSNLGLTLGKATFIASLPMILSLIGSPVLGRLADRIGHQRLFAFSIACGGIGITLMFANAMLWILIGAFVLGLAGTAVPSLMFSSLSKLVPSPSLLAQSNGILVLFQNAGMFFASLLFNRIIFAFGGDYSRASLVLIPLTVLSVVLIFRTQYNE